MKTRNRDHGLTVQIEKLGWIRRPTLTAHSRSKHREREKEGKVFNCLVGKKMSKEVSMFRECYDYIVIYMTTLPFLFASLALNCNSKKKK